MNNSQQRTAWILSTLYSSSDYVKAENLANLTGTSARTVRSDIKLLMESGPQNGFVIESKPNRGYRLQIQNTAAFLTFCGKPLQKGKSEGVVSKNDKSLSYELTLYLLSCTEPVSQEELEERVFCSATTLRSAMLQLGRSCRNAGLTLCISRGMVSIAGSEYHKRLQIASLLQRGHSGNIPNPLDPEELQSTRQQIKKLLLLNPEITISSEGIDLITYYLCISRLRNECGMEETTRVSEFGRLCEIYSFQYQLAQFLCDFVNARAKKLLNVQDLQILTMLLCVYSYPRKVDLVQIDRVCGDRRAFLMDTMTRMRQVEYLRSDAWLNEQMGLFFYAEELRRKYRLYNLVYNPLLMKLKHPGLMELAHHIYEQYCEQYRCDYSEREVTFLANCLCNLNIKTDFHDFHMKVAVASKYGLVESRRLVELFQLRYSQRWERFVPYEPYELESGETHVDRIITDCRDFISEKPTYYVGDFSREADLKELSDFLRSPKHRFAAESGQIARRLISHVNAENKEDVFRRIQELFWTNTASTRSIQEQMCRREEKMPYEIGNHAALICIQEPEIQENQLCFLTLEKHILWYQNDVSLVVVAFLKNDPENLKHLGGALTSLLIRQDLVNELIKNPSIPLLEQFFD